MTWNDLLRKIYYLNEEQRNTDVTIYNQTIDEFFAVEPGLMEVYPDSPGDGVLDDGHPYLEYRP